MNDALLQYVQKVEHYPVNDKSARPRVPPHKTCKKDAHNEADMFLIALSSRWRELLLNHHSYPVEQNQKSISVGQTRSEVLWIGDLYGTWTNP